MKRFQKWNGFNLYLKRLSQHVFASKLRFCLFCLEYILLIPPPEKELERDLIKMAGYPQPKFRRWALTKYKQYFS